MFVKVFDLVKGSVKEFGRDLQEGGTGQDLNGKVHVRRTVRDDGVAGRDTGRLLNKELQKGPPLLK